MFLPIFSIKFNCVFQTSTNVVWKEVAMKMLLVTIDRVHLYVRVNMDILEMVATVQVCTFVYTISFT